MSNIRRLAGAVLNMAVGLLLSGVSLYCAIDRTWTFGYIAGCGNLAPDCEVRGYPRPGIRQVGLLPEVFDSPLLNIVLLNAILYTLIYLHLFGYFVYWTLSDLRDLLGCGDDGEEDASSDCSTSVTSSSAGADDMA